MGDSVAEGHGSAFDKTFTALLNQSFDASDWEVVNAGVQGASPIYYAANLQRYLLFEPDAVLMVLFENDLNDDQKLADAYFKLPILDKPDTLLGRVPNDSVYELSQLFLFLRASVKQFFTANWKV